jgi:hypothetical protein
MICNATVSSIGGYSLRLEALGAAVREMTLPGSGNHPVVAGFFVLPQL